MSNNDDVLVYDLETEVVGFKPDGEKDILRVFGFYSYKNNKFGILPYYKKEAIKKVLDSHKFLVGFNNKNYDDIILKRSGYDVKYKISIDLRDIIKKRAGIITTGEGSLKDNLMKYSLDYITKYLKLVDDSTSKEQIDYDIFKKTAWTAEEVAEIKKYTIRDIEITKKLYEWLVNYFEGFKDFIGNKDIKTKAYITDTPAKFGYKADCHAMSWEEAYNTETAEKVKRPGGGYVAYPAGERFDAKIIDEANNIYKDLIIQLDFSSLYPSIMMMANLHSRNKETTEGWHGGKLFNVKGYYNDKEMSSLGKLLRKWYFVRIYYKQKGILTDGTIFKYKDAHKYIGKKHYTIPLEDNEFDMVEILIDDDEVKRLESVMYDPKEYTIKILINLQYGILYHPYYKLVYDNIAGDDCTGLGRQFTKYARKVFRDAGYPIIYTDSVSKESKIRLNNGKEISIEDYWHKYTKNNFDDDKEYADCTEPILTCDDNYKNKLIIPKRIIRHKTNKTMYNIELSNCHNLKVTEDHSLITIDPKTQKLISVKPKYLKNIKYVLVNKKKLREIKSKNINIISSNNLNIDINSDFSLVRIKSIDKYKEYDYVYDFSIEKYERFYANDILVHNTDSWYFIDVFNDKNKYLKLKDKVIKDIKDSMPFPQITFDADIDAEIKHMYFFKGDKEDAETSELDDDDIINRPKGFMKKNYIYVETNGKLTLKNLGIKKKSISALSKKIFWDYMVPEIKKGTIKFSKTWVDNLMLKLLEDDIEYAFFRKDVGPLGKYKKSMTGMQAKLSKRYGPGIHFVIPNNKGIGIGDKTTYCSYEEFKKLGMKLSDIDMSPFWKELKYFIKAPKTVSIFDYEGVERHKK